MDILNILSQNKSSYFFSVSTDDDSKTKLLTCGGLTYGQIEVEMTDDCVNIAMTNSDMAGSSMTISRNEYTNLTETYEAAVQFISDIEVYLDEPGTDTYQEANRQVLMRNMIDLLPKHPNYSR